MKINETHYFAIPGKNNVNFYKTEITGKTRISKGKYNSGWYPSEAVDKLLGKIADNNLIYNSTQKQLKDSLNKALILNYSIYFKFVSNPKANKGQIDSLLNTIRRLRAYPLGVGLDNVYEIEYNPAIGLAVPHADEKMVFILSANPDDVLQNIMDFAENEKTVETINNLSNLLYQKSMLEKYSISEKNKILRTSDSLSISSTVNNIKDETDNLKNEDLIKEIEQLQYLIEKQKELK